MGYLTSVDLLADLPENWNENQYVAPNGPQVGLSEQHGYNYLMKQVNNAQVAEIELEELMITGFSDNFLDNAYFGDVVDRLNGYCVLADTEYYSDTALENPVDVTTAPVVVRYINSTYSAITINNVEYYVWTRDAHRGYVRLASGGFTFDRWWNKNCVIVASPSSRTVSMFTMTTNVAASLRQAIPNPIRLVGRQVVLSVLTTYLESSAELKLYKANTVNSSSPVQIASVEIKKGITTLTANIPNDVGGSTYPYLMFAIEVYPGGNITMEAAKMQLGFRQTLAYIDGLGVGRVNHIPNKIVETVRCNGAPVDIGGQGMIVLPADIGVSTANVLAEAEVIDDE